MSGQPINDLRAAMPGLAAARANAVELAAASAARADAAAATARDAAVAADPAALQAATDQHTAARLASGQHLSALNRLDDRLAHLITQLPGDPCDLESDVPLALLPVRLETRYSDDGTTLRVRIYPDDVHVDRLDRGLSDQERAAGMAYWTAVWSAALTEDGAWHTLVDTVGARRAPWVAAALTPDLANRPDPPAPTPAPVFPDTGARQQRAAVARALPDRFVVTVVQSGGQVSRQVGNPVPAELVVGLPPTAGTGTGPSAAPADPAGAPSQLGKHGAMVMSPEMAWLVDPDEARRVGMLVDVPLAQPGAAVARVTAVGVRAALDPSAGAAELSALLQSHRYSSGAALVAPGTPTNNTETDRTAWAPRLVPAPPATRPQAALDPSRDGAVFARALGIDPSVLAGPGDPAPADQALAQAAQTTLWQPTWGTFIERALTAIPAGPAVDDATREAWRDYWQDHVRGQGPLPLLQLGDQPYGVLPAASVQARWHPDPTSSFEASLLTLLRNGLGIVNAAVGNVSQVGGGAALDDTLLDILGSAPQELGLRVRSLTSKTLEAYAGPLLGITAHNYASQAVLDTVLWRQLGYEPARVGSPGTTSQTTKPLGLPLVDDQDAKFLAALLHDQPRSVSSVFQALLEIAATREQAAVAQAAPATATRALLDKGAHAAADLAPELVDLTTVALAGQAEPARLDKMAEVLGQRFGVAGPSVLAGKQPIVSLRTNLAQAALTSTTTAALAGAEALSALGAWFRAQSRWARWQEAAQLVVRASTDDRHRAVAATLDCASHRYDAWVSALPTRRLGQVRASQPTGLLLGAYGWVENLVPGAATTRPGGYIHAPSLTHAATAGVLRSGYLTHNPDTTTGGALALDLSSARVRRGLDLLDGVRQGQPLGALLGYLIERRLHEQGLDKFTLSLRKLAPVVAGRLTDRADAVPDQAQEALAANNVVDGVRLLALPLAQILAALGQKPADNPYLDGPGLPAWAGPDATQVVSIQAILAEAQDSYHAVSDVLLAESVHQLVQGNTARAAAVMDSAAGGDAAPVDPDVVRSPTRAAALTHRVLVLLGDPAPGSGGWSALVASRRGRAPTGGVGRGPPGSGHGCGGAGRGRRDGHDPRPGGTFGPGCGLRQRRPGHAGTAGAGRPAGARCRPSGRGPRSGVAARPGGPGRAADHGGRLATGHRRGPGAGAVIPGPAQ